jgi:hypothetical protein
VIGGTQTLGVSRIAGAADADMLNTKKKRRANRGEGIIN